jgi:excisionase family DNA binding protein
MSTAQGTDVQPLLYTVAQTAQALACSVTTVRVMMRRGVFPVVRVGYHVRIPAAAVHAYANPQTVR